MKFKRNEESVTFRKLRKMEKTCDVVFLVGDQRLQAHRNVLALASPFFENLLYGGMKETLQKEVTLSKFSPETWKAVLNFVYGEVVNFPAAEIPQLFELLDCANYCQIKALEPAKQFGRSKLKQLAFKFVTQNFFTLPETSSLDSLDAKTMEGVISCPALMVRSELDVLRAIISWLEANNICLTPTSSNVSSRSKRGNSEIRRSLLKHLRTEHIGPDVLREMALLADKSNLSSVSTMCFKAFLEFKYMPHSLLRSSPIPIERRFARARNSSMFTITHRFYFTFDQNAVDTYLNPEEPQTSPWLPGMDGSFWQFRIDSERPEDPFCDGLFKAFQASTNIDQDSYSSEHYSVQLFAHNPSEMKFVTTREDIKFLDGGWKCMEFITVDNLESFVESGYADSSPSAVFGATIHYHN